MTKDRDGRTLVSGTAAGVIGSLWLLGSLAMGITTAPWPDLGTTIEFTLGWAAFGFIPALVLVLVWSHLDSGEKRD
ncbi:hypothetical protein [Intrasporangium sp.]|uniref:hypothetical protein n=1 Tax=Intrasporangium sp. TaxID=1925024 RepID=UPI00293AE2D1|nr:hypothetical protein [Intrasporangium sp.]MDV3222793.1 hypothetical protein [Intrasporangium sp.]